MSTSPAPASYTEPWLRGTHTDIPAAGRAVLHALELSLDDLTKWTAGLTDSEVHSQPLGLTSIAFHLRHIARSTDRVLTYAEGNQLSPEQLAALKSETQMPDRMGKGIRKLWPNSLRQSKSLSATPPTASASSPRPTSTLRASSAASNCPHPSAER